MKSDELRGRVALVTGGGRGIGAATARALAAAGARVVVAGRSPASLQEVVEAIRGEGGEATAVVADVAEAADVASMVRQVLDRHGVIDVLVNNAGIARVGPVRDFPAETWDQVMAINLRGPFLCCRAVLPGMEARGAGHIVNVASVAARVGFPEWSAYAASKAGLAAFSRSLLEEVRPRGIRVSVIYPGACDSPLWESFAHTFDRARMLRPDDVADAIVYVVTRPPTVLMDEVSLGFPAGNQ